MGNAADDDNGKMLRHGARSHKRYDLSHPNARRARQQDKKFIPDGDSDFARMARIFADVINRDPSRYLMSVEDCKAIADAVAEYRDALAANTSRYTRSMKTVALKDDSRSRAEKLIREAGNFIRASLKIDELSKKRAGVNPRPGKTRRRTVPQTAPALSFAGPVPFTNTVDGMHVIRFRDPLGKDSSDAKPAGAVRMELYYDLVPINEPIPAYPGQRTGGVKLYLRSFTRSPLTVKYPKADQPMRVVYWGCWADATGEQGPFSPTLATRVEGVDQCWNALPGRKEQKLIITSGLRQLPELVEQDPVDETRLLPDESAEAAGSRRDEWHDVRRGQRGLMRGGKQAIELSQVDRPHRRELDADGTPVGGVVDQPGAVPRGAGSSIARTSRKVEVRRERFPLAIGHFEIRCGGVCHCFNQSQKR
jgi:hypothetical protein